MRSIMKRLGLTFVAAFCLTVTTFAAGNQPVTETAKWDGSINVSRLSKYLDLDSKQHEEVANIIEFFNREMSRATSSKAKNREQMLRNAVYGNLKLMKKTLDEKQYTNYTKVLNVTLRNKGIEIK